jgi:hypothetical protein
MNKTFHISGHTIHHPTRQGIPNLRVEAWDKDLIFNDLVGSATTDEQGRFQITFTEAYFRECFLDRRPDLFFKVLNQNNDLIASTEDSVLWNVESEAIEVVIEVDLPVPETVERFVVKGQIQRADGTPYAGIFVRAFDKDLRREQALGSRKVTNQEGRYKITYTRTQFCRADKGGADLIVRVYGGTGDTLLAQSDIIFNAKPVEIVDLTVIDEAFQQLSEYERLILAVTPLLGEQAITSLREDTEEKPEEGKYKDLTFLSGETGYAKNLLARLAMAHRLAQQAIQPEFWFALLGGSVFQYSETQNLDQQLATILAILPSLDATAVRKALTRSFNQKEIPAAFQENVDRWVEAFLQFIASLTVSQPDRPTFVKLALEDAGIQDAEKQIKFARLFNQYKTFTPELLQALEQDQSFTQPEIADIRTSFQLADLSQGNFSVVKAIKQEFSVRQPEQIRPLAKKSESEWVNLVTTKYAAGEIELPFEVGEIAGQAQLPKDEVYGKMLDRQFREAFPTMAFTGGLERALQNGSAHGLRHAAALRDFLNRHETFELLNTSVDDFFENGIHADDRVRVQDESFRLEVKAVQRVFKLAPTFEATDALLADDLHSAQKVYRLGESEFVRQYGDRAGFTRENARLAWNRAADTHAAVLTIIGDLKAYAAEALPLALKNGNEALSNFPNWNNLFQTGDLCECEHCRSVLSPAAYFADLLMFLKDRKAKNPANTVKDILFARRPDLGFLELNCDNALVPLPYVDVVCEVLEDVVDATGENDLELLGFTTMPADSGVARAAVTAAFQAAFNDPSNNGKEKIELSSDFSLSQVNPSDPNQWVVHGDKVTYLLKKKAPSPNFFAEILRNTKASTAELRSYPQYVNPKAYDKLRQAKYPMTLPFDLFAEEVRAGFQKTNLQRWDLMRVFRGTAAPNNPTDDEIAAEYFGISVGANPADPSEKNLILVADSAGQQEIWRETGNADWLNPNPTTDDQIQKVVGNVKKFLQKTKLEYNELLALLDLKFINPTGTIAIRHFDPSCDTDKKAVLVLDAPTLDRIHRFLRLWGKLNGWKMWELDLVIRHPSIGNGALDEAFLINLFYFSQLKNKLGGKTTVEQVCALFGNLNTETRFTKLHEKREDALYQNLFLNKRLIQPLDAAFQLDPNTGDLPTGQTITAHQPVVLAALGIREADLVLLKELTKPSDGTRYITDDLTLANLSFPWRNVWLSKLLKFKVEDWKLVLKIFHLDIWQFASPQAAWEFVEHIDHLKATGFTPDELNWLLAGDSTAKSAPKETDATRFLAALRQALQAIKAGYDPTQYGSLSATPPTDVDGLMALLTALLQKLNRSEAEVNSFLATLQGSVLLEASVQGLPLGFTFPAAIVGAPNHIPIQYDEPNQVLRFIGLITDAQPQILLNDASLAAEVKDNPNYQNAIADLFQQSSAAVTNYVSTQVPSAVGIALPSDRPSIPIGYNAATQTLSFVGVMTTAEQSALKLSNPAAATAIDELFRLPRLAVKFYEPIFTASLEKLPSVVDFQAQLPAELAAKISYDAEQQLLRFVGIMTQAEQVALDALVPNVLPLEIAYHNAINSLATQPITIAPPDDRIWLTDSDLDITQPANDTYAKRLANAASKALNYLSKTSAENAVVQQSSTQLGLTEAVSRHLLTQYAVVPNLPNPAKTLLTHLTGDFTIDSTIINAWFWANRVAAIWKKWKLSLVELKKIAALTASAQLLDLLTLPLDSTGAIADLERFLRTNRLMRLRDSLPETSITFFEVLEKLNSSGSYTKDNFADDVQLLNEAWLKADVKALTDSLNLTYLADYLLAETWERLRRTFYFIDNLNASADTVKKFAAATMGLEDAKTLKELLRSKFGTETWLTLSAEIQDVLRERKRDALSAYLLTQPKPADAPNGKWENTNDLYAHYLLDVEMCSCQLTSRLVQGSGSVQLFVQRCFMGLEPDVVVKADGEDGDSAWRWWKWMRKYRVWEANRKVFLWPENWIEPELKKDRSPFFKDLENELLQNEINQDTVEKAFINYLEKLDGVAQLEIAGFYQEDDGNEAIVHVFGRTTGAEPHLYYYRRYDYRQWTPWEKVDLDIQGDYLIPAVVNKRLFLFWPIFTEVPDEDGNSKVSTPNANQKNVPLQKTKKKLRLQMAVSDYRQGKWTPKRVSKDFDESGTYDVEIVKKHYQFFPVDRSEIDGRFGIKYEGYSLGSNGHDQASLYGAFEISGCKGVPELTSLPGYFRHAIRPEEASTGYDTTFLKWVELSPYERTDKPENDFTLENFFSTQPDSLRFTPLLIQTPWIFKMTPPWHLSYLDKFWLDGQLSSYQSYKDERYLPTGTWLPFFYNDKKRTFFALPSVPQFGVTGGISVGGISSETQIGIVGNYYYPQIKGFFRWWESFFEGQIQTWLDSLDFSALTPQERFALEQFLYEQFPEEAPPPLPVGASSPYTPEQIQQLKNLLKRYGMRFVHYYLGAVSLWFFQFRQFHFKNYYHPLVCDFAKLVYNPLKGIPTLMSRETQLKNTGFRFFNTYQPTPWVVWTPDERQNPAYPKEDVDFTPDGAYSPYNWELFFHAPLLIANSLSKNQRFEEARDWYHFIFNPIGVESTIPGGSPPMSKYWITKPFFETTEQDYIQQRIDNILRMLAGDTTVPGYSAQAKTDLENQVLDWRINPFEPHRIANYRTVAYQKTVVMKYLDNLIAWGDNLFRQDSMESINEATQLYILAAEILGPRPKKIPPQAKPPVESFNELETQFDKFSNALVQVENLVPVLPGNGQNGGSAAPLPMLYFCIPQNDKMLGYWDTVADRLYKIRHCMNIEGVVRQLALFEPPIDPGALVKAVAGGVDISSALADLNAPLPLYRFNVLLQKANEVCNDVKALGIALLSALEKKDAEALSLLRQGQEIRLLEAVKAVREQQIEEAKENLEGVKKSKELAEIKKRYYESRDFMNLSEILAISLSSASTLIDAAIALAYVLSGGLKVVPQFMIGAAGFGGSPTATAETGGRTFGEIAEDAALTLSSISRALEKGASIASTIASYQRRQDDWDFQKDLAVKEIEQLEKQISSAELRITIAEKELENHVIQIENAKAIDEFMRSKYTNQELYQWQIGQISGVYFQSYRLAYDLAKRAERCFRFELGLQDSSYINFGYWDSLKKGLLSGEKLQYDLRRLETAYLEQNRREFELTKHISLTLLDPLALVKLRETGRFFINLPEEIFDLDYPGHYFRRIKSVSLTLPCVVGPYTTISCTLRLLKNSIRINTKNGDNGYPRNTDDQGLPADDDRFIENNIPVKAIAASNAQNDSGVFELSFRDERYLPFEGAGAISQWSLELFNDLPANNPDSSNPDFGKPLRQFDYSTITDAILHIKYTAREDAGAFKNGAIAHLRDYFSQDGATPSLRMFNLRQEFPSQWHRFLNPSNPADGNVFELDMLPSLFPIRDQDKTLKVNKIWLLARCTDSGSYTVVMTPPLSEPPPAGSNTMQLAPVNQYGGLHFSQKDVEIEIVSTDAVIKWQLKMTRPGGGNLQQDPVKKVMEVEDMLLVLGYEWE